MSARSCVAVVGDDVIRARVEACIEGRVPIPITGESFQPAWHRMTDHQRRERFWALPPERRDAYREDMDLFGTTLRNLLTRHGCPSMAELQLASDADLLAIRNLGRGRLAEIRRLLGALV